MIKQSDIIADMHTHTIFSEHAYSTIKENIEIAKERNIKYLAITDHYYNEGTDIHKKNETTRIMYMEENINPYEKDIQIIQSAEFNLNQSIYNKNKMQTLKWKPIGLHSWFVDIPNTDLDTLYHLFKNSIPFCNCFVHIERELHKVENGKYKVNPYGKGLCSNIELFLEAICIIAKENNIYLELNENSILLDECGGVERIKYWLEYAKRHGNYISLGSDAHYCKRVGDFTNSIKLLNEIKFPQERILNCNEELLLNL